MMKRELMGVILFFCCALFGAQAQEIIKSDTVICESCETFSQAQPTDDRYRVVTNRFWANWFVLGNVGGHAFFGDYGTLGGLSEKMSPNFSIGFGKWFTPGIGVKAQFGMSNSKGFSEQENWFTYGDPMYTADGTPYWKKKMQWTNFNINAMFNLSRLIRGYEGKVSDELMNQFILSAGVGTVHQRKIEAQRNEWSGHLELQYSRFFDKEKIILTGNPIRQGLLNHSTTREEAISTFGLDPNKRTILILGGSLGARTINQCLIENLDKVKSSGVQFIWQTGKIYIEEAKAAVAKAGELPMLHVTDFISDMATAYCAADLVISRAGAGSISEFCLLQKPVILVPSPNVAEDHQTKNALALVNKNAALYVKDIEAKDLLLDKAIEAVKQPDLLKNLSKNITELAFTDSANIIAKEVIKLAEKYKEEHGC
jgi:UDP-N-acetylglucosamine transferase subunit ALG13